MLTTQMSNTDVCYLCWLISIVGTFWLKSEIYKGEYNTDDRMVVHTLVVFSWQMFQQSFYIAMNTKWLLITLCNFVNLFHSGSMSNKTTSGDFLITWSNRMWLNGCRKKLSTNGYHDDTVATLGVKVSSCTNVKQGTAESKCGRECLDDIRSGIMLRKLHVNNVRYNP